MSSISDAAAALRTAAATVPGLRPYDDRGATIDPPAVVIGPPELSFRAVSRDSVDATFTVFLVMPQDDRAIERLLDKVLALKTALETASSATVDSVDLTAFPAGGIDLPAYAIQLRYAIEAPAV